MICTLQDKKLKVIFSSEGACLLHFENLETGWNAIAQPKLATGDIQTLLGTIFPVDSVD